MKHLVFSLACSLLSQLLLAHGSDPVHPNLQQWSVSTEKEPVQASFLMFKAGEVYLEDTQHVVRHFPLNTFSTADQALVRQKCAHIEALNRQQAATPVPQPVAAAPGWLWGLALLALAGLLFGLFRKKSRQLSIAGLLCLAAMLYGFKSKVVRGLLGSDPAFLDAAFAPFKPAVHTFWDADYFYVESKGIPDHEMMTGIVAWQQQVPIPQCYTGSNAWPIPLNPVEAPVPVPVSPQHFLRGAIAVAANGVPIFNPYTNTGVDAKLDGQLDSFGGHCGRADDYHYHIAPLHLDGKTPEVLPIAFGLDGYAVYADHEPDGSPMNPLDANHGHYGANGVYHYHGTPNAPYMIGNMVGKVTEDNTLQIIPQAHANPIRPSGTPLKGAVITDCTPNNTNNGYTLTYTKDGQTYSVEYSWTPAGVYTFHFNGPTGTTTEVYYGFVQCALPTATGDVAAGSPAVLLYPNPTTGGIYLQFSDAIIPQTLRGLSIYDVDGGLIYRTEHPGAELELGHLPKGVYLIHLQFQKGQLTQKVLIQ